MLLEGGIFQDNSHLGVICSLLLCSWNPVLHVRVGLCTWSLSAARPHQPIPTSSDSRISASEQFVRHKLSGSGDKAPAQRRGPCMAQQGRGISTGPLSLTTLSTERAGDSSLCTQSHRPEHTHLKATRITGPAAHRGLAHPAGIAGCWHSRVPEQQPWAGRAFPGLLYTRASSPVTASHTPSHSPSHQTTAEPGSDPFLGKRRDMLCATGHRGAWREQLPAQSHCTALTVLIKHDLLKRGAPVHHKIGLKYSNSNNIDRYSLSGFSEF